MSTEEKEQNTLLSPTVNFVDVTLKKRKREKRSIIFTPYMS
jgi:hypothetical protein